ncbi:unnamed protein product, partial [Prunus brigantina]
FINQPSLECKLHQQKPMCLVAVIIISLSFSMAQSCHFVISSLFAIILRQASL